MGLGALPQVGEGGVILHAKGGWGSQAAAVSSSNRAQSLGVEGQVRVSSGSGTPGHHGNGSIPGLGVQQTGRPHLRPTPAPPTIASPPAVPAQTADQSSLMEIQAVTSEVVLWPPPPPISHKPPSSPSLFPQGLRGSWLTLLLPCGGRAGTRMGW